jgi:hypothetical protein
LIRILLPLPENFQLKTSKLLLPMPAKNKTMSVTPDSSAIEESITLRASAFNDLGFQPTIDLLCEEICELYFADALHYQLAA